MPYLESVGIERSTASMVAMFLPIISIPSLLAFGWLSDTYRRTYIIAATMLLSSVGLFLLSIIDGSSFALIAGFIIVYGAGFGAQLSLRPPIMREYFGSKKFGSIFGLGSIFITIGAISTPPLAGWVFDTRGVYDPIWLVLSGVCMLGVILILTLPRASKKLKPVGS
jgi:MFS family permease